MGRREDIEIGQRYVANEPSVFGLPPRAIWLVAEVRRATDGVLYANLVNEKQTNRKKTIAVDALADPRLYHPAAAIEAQSLRAAAASPIAQPAGGAASASQSQKLFGTSSADFSPRKRP